MKLGQTVSFLLFAVSDVNGKSDGGVSYWMMTGNGSSQSNVGLAIAVTVMAGLAVAATLVYSNR